jgi:hydroxysqualene synthase
MNLPSDGESGLETLALTHYENFPVASRFLPARTRRPIHLIYAFARTGDDIADEWPGSKDVRLRALSDWSGRLHTAVEHGEGSAFFLDLAAAIRTFGLDIQLFDDLITAFKMDVCHSGFRTYADLLQYCRHSANPVGRLMLQIFGCASKECCELSDEFCTALQLANFWQDLFIDTARGRFYIPEEDCAAFSVTRQEQQQQENTECMRELMKFEVERTRMLFAAARPLTHLVPSALSFELKLIWHGGARVLEKIERNKYDTLSARPALGMWDKLLTVYRACISG